MRELSLFTGAGGGVLGSKILGWEAVGYVEWERYCQKVIAQRIQDGFLDEAPIFGDIDEFIESGAAKKYEGFVDVVTAGFPCTPFSNAGRQKFEKDSRNKWPETIQAIRDVRPRFALLENVPGLLSSGYFPTILSDLAEAGFDARWIVLGANDVGAPHQRKRLWILAYTNSDVGRNLSGPVSLEEWRRSARLELGGSGERFDERGAHKDVADTDVRTRRLWESRRAGRELPQESEGLRGGPSQGETWEIFGSGGEAMAYPDSSRLQQGDEAMAGGLPEQPHGGSVQPREDVPHSDEPGLQGRLHDREFDPEGRQVESDGCPTERGPGWEGSRDLYWWSTEPDVGRVAHGVASRVDRLKALGNGQVPLVVASAWQILTGAIHD